MEQYLCDKLPDDFKFWTNLPTIIIERFRYWEIKEERHAEYAAGAIVEQREDGTRYAKIPSQLLQPQGWYGLGTIYVHPPVWHMFYDYIKEGMLLGEGMVPLDRDTITPYLKYYFDGFQKGYHSFDEKIKASSTSLFALTEKEIIKKIYEHSKPGFLVPMGEVPFTVGLKNGSNISEESWTKSGEELGMLYRSWYIILTNPDKFIEHFAEDSQQSTPPSIADVAGVAENTTLNTVVNHLRCLSGKKGATEIMKIGDYELLIKYCVEMIDTGKPPTPERRFPLHGITNGFLLKLFKRLHDAVHVGSNINHNWGQFMYDCFPNLEGYSDNIAGITIKWSQLKDYKFQEELNTIKY
jgi:hypothetical protein